MHNFCFAVTSCFLFRLQLALFNTSFRHVTVICAHTPRRAMLQERSERCSHKEENPNKLNYYVWQMKCIGETGALWTSGYHEHLSFWPSALSNFNKRTF